ncbi:hypothetical protein [Desulfonatronum parangueonense]
MNHILLQKKQMTPGHGAFGKTIVFGIFRRNGKVFTEIVPVCKRAPIQRLFVYDTTSKALFFPMGEREYYGLVNMGHKTLPGCGTV